MRFVRRACAEICRALWMHAGLVLVALWASACGDELEPAAESSDADRDGAALVPSWAPDATIDFYARARFELSPAGVQPRWGVIIHDGSLSPDSFLRGEILIVGSFGPEVRWTLTALDPRIVSGHTSGPTGVDGFRQILDTGLLTFSFPGQHVQTPEHLRASRFDVYQLGPVPTDIVVAPDNLAALRRGATLLGSVAGSDMIELYF